MTSPAATPRARSPLTRERILDAAVRLADDHGIEAVSMRKLGAELEVEAMSLYNHFASKAALLDGMVDHVVGEVPIPDAEAHWQKQVRAMARGYRTLALRHPHIVPLIAMRPFNTLTALLPVEYAFGVLRKAGFDEDGALHAFRTVAGFATGYTLAETGGFFAEGSGPADDSQLDPTGLSSEDFPNLVSMIPHITNCDHDAEFEFALDVLLEGLSAKLRSA